MFLCEIYSTQQSSEVFQAAEIGSADPLNFQGNTKIIYILSSEKPISSPLSLHPRNVLTILMDSKWTGLKDISRHGKNDRFSPQGKALLTTPLLNAVVGLRFRDEIFAGGKFLMQFAAHTVSLAI